jgi:hypothetical protein
LTGRALRASAGVAQKPQMKRRPLFPMRRSDYPYGRRRAINHAVIQLVNLLFALSGCAEFGERVAVGFFYQAAVLPENQVHKNLSYGTDAEAHEPKHRLDLYIPKERGWPVLIFVHGGEWKRGDKDLRFGGADPYGNIGRFYAARGIGVAVINYRLQPAVTWRDQVKDVVHAVGWVYQHAKEYGGNARALFVSGHSSGAQLASFAALDHELLQESGLPSGVPCGVISVSGAPFDVADSKTYELGTDPAIFEKPFRAGDPGDRWKYAASSVRRVIT